MDFGFRPERRFVRESRPLDYVYDHVYTTSSRNDFCNAALLGSRAFADVKLRPIYRSMFSELRRDRRLQACLVDKIPGLTQNFLPPCNKDGEPTVPHSGQRELEPTGADRAIFALRYASDVHYKLARPVPPFDMDGEMYEAKKAGAAVTALHVTRGQQTDYRESETQTDPYSPPYKVHEDEPYPRVLALINLTWGKGLPATLDDIVTIQRALTRRAAELAKITVDDESELLKHSKVMEELEAHLWADREKELYKIMERKREVMKKMRLELQLKIANLNSTKLANVYETEKRKNSVLLGRIRQKYLRDLRNLERKYCKREAGSRVEAYLREDDQDTLEDYYSRNKRQVPEYEFPLSKDYELFQKLTTSEKFKRDHLDFNCQEFTKCILGTRQTNREQRTERMLDEAFSAFRNQALKKPEPSAATISNRMKGQIRRVQTPTVEGPTIEEEMANNAIILLQKVIRGRAVQTMMRDEIRANASTLADLRGLHETDPTGIKASFGEIAAIKMMQQERDAQLERETEISEITDQLEGETLGHQLEFLDKEMIRLQDERKIHCLLMLAERERRMKEAIEGGRRQQEEDERRRNDEIFRQIVGIHQSTVDIYLEDMYLNCVERTADANARAYVQGLAATINEAAYGDTQNALEESEEMTADIVHSFLMPEMNRIYQRQRMDAVNNRYVQAAHEVSSSLCTAQGVVGQLIDSLHTVIPTHLDRGEAAVDGTQVAVDQMIKEAVAKALQSTTQHRGMLEVYGEEDMGEYLPEPEQPIVAADEAEERIRRLRKSEKIPVDVPCLEVALGIKSIELETGTEVGPDAVNLMLAAKHVTCTVLDEAQKVVERCFGESEGEERPESDDDDDEESNTV